MSDLINLNSPIPGKVSPGQDIFSQNYRILDRSIDLLSNSFSNFLDIGRESFPAMGRPSITGRESLQILKHLPDAANVLSDNKPGFHIEYVGRASFGGSESLKILNDLHNMHDLDMDCGRESLGILNVNSPDLKFNERDFLHPDDVYIGNSNLSLNPLDTAMLHITTSSRIKSTFSSTSSFNSNILEPEISKIYSVSSIGSASDNFNDAFLVNGLREHNRLGSEHKSPNLEEESDDVFNDSIFIEAHHLASKMADGSILDDSFDGGNILDSTPHPVWEVSEELEEEEESKCQTETVFKAVDKLLPVINVVDAEVDLETKNESKCSSDSQNECKENLSQIFNLDKRINVSRSSSASSGSKSRDAKEILQNLSVILTSDSLDSEQKLAGQSLLYNLADILCSNENCKKDEPLEDSGHSSLGNEDRFNLEQEHRCYEVLDLSTKSNTTDHKEKPMDLSKTKKQLSHSFSFPSPKVPPPRLSNNLKMQSDAMKNITSSMEIKIGSNSRLSGLYNNTCTSKLKPRKTEDKESSSKKGPLRAIIPINIMSKKAEFEFMPKLRKSVDSTPPKKYQLEPQSKSKKTSTPINDSKLKPMAQSTPDDHKYGASIQLKKRLSCPVSPLARPTLNRKLDAVTDLNKSDLLPDMVNNNNNSKEIKFGLNRRKSASDLKAANSRMPLKRSFSIGKENPLSALRKPVDKSKPTAEKTAKIEENKILKNENSNRSSIKPFNLMAKLRNKKTVKVASN